MTPQGAIPTVWLMTDERLGDALWPALDRLPRGAGVVFRHYSTPKTERRSLFNRVRRVARARGLVLVLAGSARQAIGWRADGAHGWKQGHAARPLVRTAPAHAARQLVAARRAGAAAVFVSPILPTRSHPGARTLGPVRFGLLAQRANGPAVIALGGVTQSRAKRLRALGAHGWAAIDAWAPEAGMAVAAQATERIGPPRI